ncbi:DUF3016 domain-containing protein [Pseudomonas guariconensis]|uniref:DUF3016 domain-containing protein n=1 Tax=Pseudomonas TaxID=286 RepID=UPI001CE3D187|nr:MULTISPECIES: DUF3016 domain-containing protein [Pseudomonas]MCO7637469.1 DUF3016 domain-containing protein [Pseudomonas sp. S 311-6]MCO7514016.1 DUF3016 domain-containing protein [Pseudomonas putida]MCO7564027.1 DUF3016 domain-containing protein [Pseudomonas mosselii]MCO7593897.1 DUF3016 domain-containing protein [Pseudomonas guariconensis]MCO7604920.1 DUF3016 domain-containing protein [Pseudomonas guariconensis]
MRTALACTVLMVLAFDSMAQGTPTAQVEVRFDHPEKFRDASLDSQGYERGADAYVMKSLTQHLQKLGQRYLQPGQQLRIAISDIDLAGRYEPWHGRAYDVRFMREITWPSIDLSYTLSQPGQPDRQAQERVSDKMYLSRPGRQASSSDRLYAEKAMLDDWFRQRFAPLPAS